MEHKYPRVFDDGFDLWAVDEDGRVMFACGRLGGSFEHMDSVRSLQHLLDDVFVEDGLIELEELV